VPDRTLGPASLPGRQPAARWAWATIALTVGALAGVPLVAPTNATAPAVLVCLLFVGSSVHVASTAWLFTLPSVRRHARSRPVRYLCAPALLTAGGCAGALILPPHVVTWLLLPFFAWQFHHFQKQNLGLVALCASSAGVAGPARRERRSITAAGLCAIAGLLAHPALLQLDVRPVLGPAFAVAGVGYGAAVSCGALSWARERHDRVTRVGALYALALLFPLPIFLFASPWAAVAGMTIAHGFQYLALTGLVALGQPGHDRRPARVAWLATMAVVGGLLLGLASHLHGSGTALRGLFGVYLGLVMTHFVVDAGLWRQRDPFPRRMLASRVPWLRPAPALALDRLPIDRLPI
jgi:hypothetical protein